MNIFKKLNELLFGSPNMANIVAQDKDGIYFYVKCSHCGAPVRIRVARQHDLQQDFDTGGYILRKEIMDGQCFRLMYATLHFDAAYHRTGQEITGGEFITAEQYATLTRPATDA